MTKFILQVCLSLFVLLPLPAMASDVLVFNVHGYAPTNSGIERFDALLIRDGRVVARGEAGALAERSPHATGIDGHGHTLLPGLIDAHGHVRSLALESLQADLRGTASLDEALARVEAYAKAHPDLLWILGRGWNQVLWSGKNFPTAADLDRVVTDRPAWLRRVDGHAAWANSRALAAAGITVATADPPGGRIVRDVQGRPSGVLVDEAMKWVDRAVPEWPPARQAQAMAETLDQLAALGLTEVHDAGVGTFEIGVYENLAHGGRLPIRIYAMLSGDAPELPEWLKRGPRPDLDDGMLSFRSVKFYADGALGSRGAALLNDYSDQPSSRGLLRMPPDVLTARVRQAACAGFQVNVHAIGDRANRIVLDAFERLPQRCSARRLRHRIEHAQVVALSDIPRFKAFGVIASMQPTHATSDMNMAEDRLGPERIRGAYAWRAFLDQGTRIAAGSDFPVELPNPFLGLYAAVTRMDTKGQPPGGWRPRDRMTRAEALRAFTRDAAYAAFQEKQLGSLEPGQWADFILTDQDFFEVVPEDIWRIRVLQTWVAGAPVFTASP